MRVTRLTMGMPVTVEIVAPEGDRAATGAIEAAFAEFAAVDALFSPFRSESEVSRINRGELAPAEASAELREILALAEQTRRETGGYFDIARGGAIDPSGIVKGWAIQRVADGLRARGYHDYYVDAGGDIQAEGLSPRGRPWRVGIRSPFRLDEIIKVVAVSGCGVATSGTSARGNHIYDPHRSGRLETDVVSLTVIGPNVYEADRFATAAFAMGRAGIAFIERIEGFEGYMVDSGRLATLTSGFARFIADD